MKKARTTKQREPSKASLREIPEIDFAKATVRKNPYANRIAKEGFTVRVGRGRPTKADQVGGTAPRSVRFPDDVWKELEQQAKRRGLTLHAALREAILTWLKRAA